MTHLIENDTLNKQYSKIEHINPLFCLIEEAQKEFLQLGDIINSEKDIKFESIYKFSNFQISNLFIKT